MKLLYPPAAQFPVGIVAGMTAMMAGAFAVQGAFWTAGAFMGAAFCACCCSAWLTIREG